MTVQTQHEDGSITVHDGTLSLEQIRQKNLAAVEASSLGKAAKQALIKETPCGILLTENNLVK